MAGGLPNARLHVLGTLEFITPIDSVIKAVPAALATRIAIHLSVCLSVSDFSVFHCHVWNLTKSSGNGNQSVHL